MTESVYPSKQQHVPILPEVVGESVGITNLRAQVAHLLGRQGHGKRLPSLLIQGETGTGKGLLARAIHRASIRSAQPFVDIDCAAIPETLLEAELFGFERGAFTDARYAKPGLFQTASGGTIFLDEVGLLPRSLQGKLLKVVEERGVRRLGSTHTEVVDLWILAATNVDLGAAVREGHFREDLYHRLAAVTLMIPPLRSRDGDILLLANRFLARACAEYRLPPKTLASDAQAALIAYPWPGNVRQLANTLERVVLLTGEDTVITDAQLALPAAPTTARPVSIAEPERGLHRSLVEGFERDRLLEALRSSRGNIAEAAARLGLPRNTLRYRMSKLRMKAEDFGKAPRRQSKPPVKMTKTPATRTIGQEMYRILVVEDDPVIRNLLVDLLSDFGHYVESATSGSEALSLLGERSYALILSDLRMPETDGEGLYQKIAQTWPHLTSRVAFVTGDTPSPALGMFLGGRNVPILRKPFTSDELRWLVERMLFPLEP